MKQQDILTSWRDVEIFNLPDFNNDCYLLQPDVPFPWKNERPLRNPKANIWRYTLFFGKIEKREVINTIEGLLEGENSPMDWEDPVVGDTCFSALLLDKNGRPDNKSYVPASFTFGINCLEEKVSMENVSIKLSDAQVNFELRYNIPPLLDEQSETKGPPITWQHLQQEIKYLNSITKSWNNTSIEVYIIAKEVPKDAEPDTSFLNSFYLNDLNMLITKGGQDYGTALQRFISLTVRQEDRKDLILNRNFLCESIDPNLMPIGRWPANISYGLYTAQSGAVNTTIAGLKNGAGIKGINGPPGTGKTTLLLDIIADVVVTRAIRLIQTGPDKLFERYKKIEKENGFSGYFGLSSDQLYDSGIVVASNNNAAVENITKTLPSIDKIDSKVFKDADYFSEYAQRIIEGKSWGILSAALGNAQNKSNFKWKFWLNDTDNNVTGFQEMLWNVYRDTDNDQTYVYRQKFDEVKDELEDLIKQFNVFKQKASHFHKQYPVFKENINQKNRYEGDLHSIEDTIASLSNEKRQLEEQITAMDELIRLSENMLSHIRQQKPSFFFLKKLFNTRTYQKWKLEYSHNMNHLREHTDKRIGFTRHLENVRSKLNSGKATETDIKRKLNEINKDINKYHEEKKELHQQYGIDQLNIIDEDFYTAHIEKIHTRTPYSSEIINKLRSDIFIKSLELHRYCILSNAKQIRNNLNLFFEMIEGRALIDKTIGQTLWGTLFLCVPVISTTLASVSRLFSSIGKESIGWLLLDEAGQATPQSAAGIIWRSKRCIIVGDPLQIEPVITIPSKLIFKLRQQKGIDQVWSPSNSSVQVLADRVSELGTYMSIGNYDEKIWTGFPLRTHRRCDNPMFDIANKIAYAGQMVKATKDIIENGYIGDSVWFHIKANNAPINKHVLTEELDLLKGKINALRVAGYTNEIFVISPFKSVAKAGESIYKHNAGVSCGTIHRFQGKEADVVFLVLGGNPTSQGARDWVSEKPNMLNVALTRARKRFYVIGNKSLWGNCSYFNIMAAKLPVINISN